MHGIRAHNGSENRLKTTVFGAFRVETSRGHTLALNNRRASLILAVLCLQPDLSIDRGALARLLWPGRFDAQARASLRQCLLDLRRTLEEHHLDVLRVTRSDVALDPAAIECDLFELERALAHDPAAATELMLLAGNHQLIQGASLNPEIDAWLMARRDQIDTRLKVALSKALATLEPPLAKALLEAAQVRFPSLSNGGASSGRVAMAVLPFHQSDDLGEGVYLGEAVVDELSSRLSRIEGVALMGRTSVEAVASKGETLPGMAKALGVSHLIEGSVRPIGDAIEVRMALIEGPSGIELWSRTVSGSIEDFLQSRNVIGANIIAAICSALGLKPAPASTRPMTGDREAYALYLQGRSMAQRIGSDGALPKAIAMLEEALQIDPRFAECWTALADAHIMTAATTPTLERVMHTQEGAKCAHRALELDAGQAHAYSVLGVAQWCEPNPAKALDLAYEAYARDPNDADVASRLGSTLLYLGKTKEALPYIETSVDRDPVNSRNYVMLASAYLNLGDIGKARSSAQRIVNLGAPRMWLSLAQFIEGDYEAAVENHFANRFFLGTTIMRPPGMPPMDDAARDAYFELAARGLFSGREADRARYCQMINGLHAAMPDPHDTSILLPAIWMGDCELVMKIFSERIHPANVFGLISVWIDADPFNRTRLHPDFMAFADKIGLTEAWNRHGWPDLMPTDPRTTASPSN